MKLYAGFDLHSQSSHLAVSDEHEKNVFKAKLTKDTQVMTLALEPYRARLAAIALFYPLFAFFSAVVCSCGVGIPLAEHYRCVFG